MYYPTTPRDENAAKVLVDMQDWLAISKGLRKRCVGRISISTLGGRRKRSCHLHSFPADYILSCYAGHGQISGEQVPFGFLGRTEAAFESVSRKVQDAGIQRLHMHRSSGNIKGFILSYLGQQDNALPIQPAGLVRREEVFGCPTNFAAMSEESIRRITSRGEQLTRVLIDHYCPEL